MARVKCNAAAIMTTCPGCLSTTAMLLQRTDDGCYVITCQEPDCGEQVVGSELELESLGFWAGWKWDEIVVKLRALR